MIHERVQRIGTWDLCSYHPGGCRITGETTSKALAFSAPAAHGSLRSPFVNEVLARSARSRFARFTAPCGPRSTVRDAPWRSRLATAHRSRSRGSRSLRSLRTAHLLRTSLRLAARFTLSLLSFVQWPCVVRRCRERSPFQSARASTDESFGSMPRSKPHHRAFSRSGQYRVRCRNRYQPGSTRC